MIAADLFCGAGGSSTGLVRAAESLSVPLDLLAINHWPVAVDTHTRNHPWARHMCADLSTIDPSKAIPGGRLDLLIASPECTHHSIARGGKPCSDQSRASAWHVLHWAERLQIDRILIENVKEFESWGPLTNKNLPDKRRKGETFQAFIAALRSLGYTVDWKILNAADYGDVTTRRRLFVQAARGRRKITWPEPTHAGKWRPASAVIDWSIKGESIFSRKRPLAPKTLARIEAGLKKFGGESFIAILRGRSVTSDVESPLPTITAGGTGTGHFALCEPFNVAHGGPPDCRAKAIDEPLGTIPAGHRGEFAICEPFILGQHSGGAPRAVSQPVPTICTESRGIALVEPFIIPMEHSGRQPVRSTSHPLPTITTARGGSFGLCEPFLTKYYGTGGAVPVTTPLDTITAKQRFALVEPSRMDIRFRMLQPHELAAAMGFDGYHFAGTKTDQVRQIGNAVSVRTAQALCRSIITGEVSAA